MASAVASVLPAGILAAIGLGILVANRILLLDRLAKWLCWVALALAAIALAASHATQLSANPVATNFLDDGFFRGSAGMALAFGLLVSLCAADVNGVRCTHRYGLLLLSLSGVVLAGGANDLIVAVVAIELAALPAAALLFVERDTANARVAWVQSCTLNLAALAILVVGVALIAGTARTTNLAGLDDVPTHVETISHSRIPVVHSPVAADVGCVLLVVGLCVHFLSFPFQLAAAEIFDGAKPWGVSLTALFARGAAFLLMIRVFVNGKPPYAMTAQTAFTAVGLVTILIGCVLAFSQTQIRRLLAFAVAVEGGAILGVLAAACSEAKLPAATPWLGAEVPGAVGSACFCFGLDSLALTGLLAILGSLERFGQPLDEIEDLAKRVRGDWFVAVGVCVLLFSLAGFPPFAGFWGRVAAFRSLLSVSNPSENDFLPHQNISYVTFSLIAAAGLIEIAVVCASVARRLVLVDRTILPSATAELPTRAPRSVACWVGLFAAGALIVVGFVPRPLLRVASRANELEAAIRSPESSPPVPSFTARRRIGIAAP